MRPGPLEGAVQAGEGRCRPCCAGFPPFPYKPGGLRRPTPLLCHPGRPRAPRPCAAPTPAWPPRPGARGRGRRGLKRVRTRGPGGRRSAGAAHWEPLLSRCPRARQNGGKVRHKRQALQDMARPLKQWLYKHRDNPYPTKTEKILLALGSQMTLVQVIGAHEPRPSLGEAERRLCSSGRWARVGPRPAVRTLPPLCLRLVRGGPRAGAVVWGVSASPTVFRRLGAAGAVWRS
ncbi:hypothetical protein J1605_001733 [Eschrichtius robustus]|uniref:KN homeodomain domain-containing protein n=1 Tax=Eschrichtius robustus TaxID=9764 RepID=A0AB34I2K3_ESCRO|nr:hypothetical protein J1605_001733 [Eschrichtius robustus]